jgi:hypothetical protein
MGTARPAPSFSPSFEIQHAIQVVISAAYRTRSSIEVEAVVVALRSTFPDHPASDADLRHAVVAAAEKADVAVASESATRRSAVRSRALDTA